MIRFYLHHDTHDNAFIYAGVASDLPLIAAVVGGLSPISRRKAFYLFSLNKAKFYDEGASAPPRSPSEIIRDCVDATAALID